MLVWMDELISDERAEEMLSYIKIKHKNDAGYFIPGNMLFERVLVDHDQKRYASCIMIENRRIIL